MVAGLTPREKEEHCCCPGKRDTVPNVGDCSWSDFDCVCFNSEFSSEHTAQSPGRN